MSDVNEDLPRKRLGRGLAALIGETGRVGKGSSPPPAADGTAPVEYIMPNPRNPRRDFAEDDLANLAQSIREHGLVQPIVVRPLSNQSGWYELIAGERRWRAAQRAGLASVPIIKRDVDDRTALEIAIVENVQRSDLNPVEEAAGYQQLIDEHGYSQADLGQVIGKSRSHVANTLRLLKLPDTVKKMLIDGALSAGHARTLVNASDPVAVARRIVDQSLSVREAEALVQTPHSTGPKSRATGAGSRKESDTEALERRISDALGLHVSIRRRWNGGEVRIAYRTPDQLDEITRRLE